MATATLSRKGNLCEHCPTEGKILNSTEKLVSHFWRSAYNSFDLNGLARRALSFQQGTTCPQNPLVQQTNKNMLGSTHSTFLFFFSFWIPVPQPRTKPAPRPLHWKHGVLTPELPGKSEEAHVLEGLVQHWKQPLSCAPAQSLSRVQLFVTPWTVAHKVPLSMAFHRQEYWSGLPFPTPGDPPDPGIESRSPALTGGFFTTEPPGKPSCYPNLTYYYLLWPHLPQIIYHTATWVTFPETIPTKLFLIKFFTGSSYNFENQFMIGFHLRLQPQLLALSHRCFSPQLYRISQRCLNTPSVTSLYKLYSSAW